MTDGREGVGAFLSMNVRVPFELCTESDEMLVAEASTIGLPPGEWPMVLTVVRDNSPIGSFRRTPRQNEGVVVYVDPVSRRELHVLND